LLLARGLNRGREMVVRAALGAGRGRLVRQVVTESVVLWTIGGTVGIAMAAWLLGRLVALAPADLPRVAEISVDPRVLAFAVGLSVLTGVVFGLLPALGVS